MKTWIDKIHRRIAIPILCSNEYVPDVAEWRSFLDSLKQPEDSIDIAYNKYLCRSHLFPRKQWTIMNILSCGALFISLFYMLFPGKALQPMKKGVALLEKDKDVTNFDDVLPTDIYKDYETVVVAENFNSKFGFLCKEAKRLLWKCIKRHPFSFYFNYFVYVELVAHSHFLLEYNSEATVVYVNERNVAGAIIREMYEDGGRKFISFMHGEYLLQLIQGYMSFSEYYVWAPAYIEMFEQDLNCKIGKYVVYTPQKLQKKWDFSDVEPTYFCTYYFSNESTKAIEKLAEVIKGFEAKGLKCKVRPHPRDVLMIKQILSSFQGITIEDATKVTLQESLVSTKYVVGMTSTVLSEAYAEGKPIVIDDINDPEQYQSLRERKSASLRKKHILLSELVKQYCR